MSLEAAHPLPHPPMRHWSPAPDHPAAHSNRSNVSLVSEMETTSPNKDRQYKEGEF